MTSKAELTKTIAEITRGLCGKIDSMNSLMSVGLYEYFTEMDRMTYLLSDLLGAPPSDHSLDIIDEYLRGRIEYGELLSQMNDAIASFDWEGYANHE